MSKPRNPCLDLEGVIFPNRDVARLLRSTCRDLNEVVRVLDSQRQSDMAGQLHTLTVELRQLALIAELKSDDTPLLADECAPVAMAH